jgi:ABC-type oligopeptide transport system substrate-binding subunit
MAIDREVLVSRIYQGGELPAYGFVPDDTANYVSQKVSWAKMSQADREAAAIKLMSEAGYGPSKPLNIRLNYAANENNKRVVVAIAAMWKKLGVNVEHLVSEPKVNVATRRQGDFEVGLTCLAPTITTRRILCSSGKRPQKRTSRDSPIQTTTDLWTRPRSQAIWASGHNC